MFANRYARLLSVILFFAGSTAVAGEVKEVTATFLEIRGDRLVVRDFGGSPREFPISRSVQFSLNGSSCTFNDLRNGDSLRLTIETPDKGKIPPMLIRVEGRRK